MTAAVLMVALVIGPMDIPVEGTATWYCGSGQRGTAFCTRGYGPDDMVAAIDRKDSVFRKGDRVRVTSGSRSVVVTIVDVCACRGRRVIDLTSGAFRRLAPLGRGVIPVTLSAVSSSPTLPPTDALPFVPPPPRTWVHR